MWYSLLCVFPSEPRFPLSTPPQTPCFLCFSLIVPLADWTSWQSASGILIRVYLHGDNGACSSDFSLVYPRPSPSPLSLKLWSLSEDRCPFREKNNWPCPQQPSVYSRVPWMEPRLHICPRAAAFSQRPLHIISSSTFTPSVTSSLYSAPAWRGTPHLFPTTTLVKWKMTLLNGVAAEPTSMRPLSMRVLRSWFCVCVSLHAF